MSTGIKFTNKQTGKSFTLVRDPKTIPPKGGYPIKRMAKKATGKSKKRS